MLWACGTGGRARTGPPSPDEPRLGEPSSKSSIKWGRVGRGFPPLLVPPSGARATRCESALRSTGFHESRGARRVPRIRAIVDNGPRCIRETTRYSIPPVPREGRPRRVLRDEILRRGGLPSSHHAPTGRHDSERTGGRGWRADGRGAGARPRGRPLCRAVGGGAVGVGPPSTVGGVGSRG